MRHQKKGFKLGRTHAHRKATLAALSNALITHKRITTTLPKARALRMFVEPIINRAKVDSTHNRRQAFRYLRSKHSVKELFGDIAEKINDRPGGYTRIVKLGQRAGDAAEMAIIELVDFNEDALEVETKSTSRRRTRRSRRRKSDSDSPKAVPASAAAKEEVVEEEVVADEVVAEADVVDQVVEEEGQEEETQPEASASEETEDGDDKEK